MQAELMEVCMYLCHNDSKIGEFLNILISRILPIKEVMIHIEICDKIPSTFECPTSQNDKSFIFSRFKIKTGIGPTY